MHLGVSQLVRASIHTGPSSPPTTGSSPKVWADVIEMLAAKQQTQLVVPKWSDLFRRQMFWFSWHPSFLFLAAALLRRRTVYLYWGHDESRSFRSWRTKSIIRSVSENIVNDQVSAEFISANAKRPPRSLPYCVDTHFFGPAEIDQGGGVIVVPGNNGRDEDAVMRLIAEGYPVLRITSSEAVRDLYASNGLESCIGYRLSFSALRDAYQQAIVVAIPIKDLTHAAGQTAVLEALACGSRVIVTSPRMASIVSEFDGVSFCPQNEFASAISKVVESSRPTREERKQQHREIAEKHSIDSVVNELDKVFRELQ